MTRILITSDTHGHYGPISDYILSHDDIDLMIHAGDGVEDCINIAYETNISYHVVKGNNDYYTNESYDKVIDKDGVKIFLTHGHRYDVYGDAHELLLKAKDNNCDIAIHGHTHIYKNEEIDGITILNPGSISLPRDNNPGFMIMDIADGKYTLERINLE